MNFKLVEKEIVMGLFNWLSENDIERAQRENSIVVKTLKSKGDSKSSSGITVEMLKTGIAVDSDGYHNEVVVFLRRNKKDR